MELITREHLPDLIANWNQDDPQPVVKIFSPIGAATWLICSIEPEYQDLMFGLCDLGMGFPELGYVSLSELQEFTMPFPGAKIQGLGLPLEGDLYFQPEYPISVYAEAAREQGGIITDVGIPEN